MVLHFEYSDAQLVLLMCQDSDAFCRWDACQRLLRRAIRAQLQCPSGAVAPELPAPLLAAYRELLGARDTPTALLAQMLQMPSETWLASLGERIDACAVHRARLQVAALLAVALREPLWACWRSCRRELGGYRPEPGDMGRRALAAAALELLVDGDSGAELVDCAAQLYRQADNLSDRLSALRVLINSPVPSASTPRAELLADFHRLWSGEPLALCHWLRVQATDRRPAALQRLQGLMRAPGFEARNPNFLRATVGAFSRGNPLNFHAEDGSGYRFLAAQVLALAPHNAQLAARLLLPLCDWPRYSGESSAKMSAALRQVAAACGEARELRDLAARSLAAQETVT